MSDCPSIEFLRVSPSIAFVLSCISFCGILAVCVSMFIKNSKKSFHNEKELFSQLAQVAITFLFINDLFAQVSYFPSQLFNIVFKSYESLDRNDLSLLWIGSQLSESFVISSGFWNLVIILCIYWSLTSKQSDVDDLEDKDLKYRTGFVLFAWGVPLSFGLVMVCVNMRFQVWFESPAEYFWGTITSNTIHSLVYVSIEIAALVCTARVFMFIRSVPTFDTESQRKKRFIMIKLLLYTIPFLIVATILIIRRTYNDLDKSVAIYRNTGSSDRYRINYCMSTPGIVLTQIHFFTSPLRGAMNSIVYFILSDTFIEFVKNMCCGGERPSERLSGKFDDEQ